MPSKTQQFRAKEKRRLMAERKKARISKTSRNHNEPRDKWERKYETRQTEINKDKQKWKPYRPISGPNFQCWVCARWDFVVLCKTEQDFANHKSGRKHALALSYEETRHECNLARQYYTQEEEEEEEVQERRRRQDEERRRCEEEEEEKQRKIKEKMEMEVKQAMEKMEETVEEAREKFKTAEAEAVAKMEEEIQQARQNANPSQYNLDYDEHYYDDNDGLW